MTTMIAEIYDALMSAGANEEKARKAAQSITEYTEYDNKFDSLGQKMDTLEKSLGELERKVIGIQGEVNLLKWMVGFNLLISTGVLIKLLI